MQIHWVVFQFRSPASQEGWIWALLRYPLCHSIAHYGMERYLSSGGQRGACTHATHGRGGMTIDPRIPATQERDTSGFEQRDMFSTKREPPWGVPRVALRASCIRWVSVGRTWVARGAFVRRPFCVGRMSMGFPWVVRGIPVGGLWGIRGLSMGCPPGACGVSTGCRGVPMGRPWGVREVPVGSPWGVHGVPVGVLGEVSMRCSGVFAGFPWVTHGVPASRP